MASAGKTILVGGGTGFIGTHLCNLMKRKKYDVQVISRTPGPKRLTWTDINDTGLPEDTFAVVNLAGQSVLDPTQRWTDSFKEAVWNSRIKTTEALTNAITKSPDQPSVFVSMSGVGIYKPSSKETYYESAPHSKGFDFISKLCMEWETAARLPSESKCRQVIIRSGAVLGRSGGVIQQIYWPFLLGLGGTLGSGNQYLPWIHVNDLTRLILFAIETKIVDGVLNGVAPQTITNKQFSLAFASSLSRPAIIPIPEFLINLVYDRERTKMITEGQKVLPKRTQEFGFAYHYPDIKSACKEIISSI